MQHATEAIGVPFARGLNVSETKYAAEVNSVTGLTAPTLRIKDIGGLALASAVAARRMGDTIVSLIPTGACISSVSGGVIEGWDMYGQYVAQTVAAAGTSTIAFAGVVKYPADALWVERYGLPYKYSAAAAAPNADVTITASGPSADARGTFVYAGAFGADGWADVPVPYVADRDALFGAPYADRFDLAVASRYATALAVVGTINNTGAIALTIPTSGLASQVPCTVTFPDGTTVRAITNSVVNHTLSPVWMSQYANVVPDVDKLVAVSFDWPQFAGVYANLTGSLV